MDGITSVCGYLTPGLLSRPVAAYGCDFLAGLTVKDIFLASSLRSDSAAIEDLESVLHG